jgi:hypothetical protein
LQSDQTHPGGVPVSVGKGIEFDGIELFNMMTETLAISNSPIPAERLQVPPGYKLNKRKS